MLNSPVFWFLAVLAMFSLAVWADGREVAACHAKGGHMMVQSSLATGVGMNGNVSVVPVRSALCLSTDGRILE